MLMKRLLFIQIKFKVETVDQNWLTNKLISLSQNWDFQRLPSVTNAEIFLANIMTVLTLSW